MPTRRSQTASASSALGASTITRTSGSVPEGRSSTRPRPSSAAASRSTASQTAAAPAIALAVGDLDVDQRLRQLLHRHRLGEVAPGELAHRHQRRGDAVAGGDEAGVDDVAGLLAAERPAALAQLVEDVAVADLGDGDLDPGLLHRPVEAVVAHHGDGDAAAELAAGGHAAGGERDQLVAVVDAAGAVDGEHPVAVAVEGEADRRLPSRRRARRSRSRWVEPQPSLMLRPSGSTPIVSTSAPSRSKIAGAARWVAPLAQSRTTVTAGEVEREGRLERAQVVLEAAVELAHAARLGGRPARASISGLDPRLGLVVELRARRRRRT